MSAPAAMAASRPGRSTTSTSILSMAPARARARRTASATPPQAATWLSLMRMPSPSERRWFCPPPARTAAFSSSRQPGRGLAGVEQPGLPPARGQGVDAAARGGGHARQPLQEVERGPLGGEEGGDGAPGRPDHLAPSRPLPVAPVEPAGRAQPLEHPGRHGGAGQHQLLLHQEGTLGPRLRVEGGLAGDVAQREVLLERELDEPLDVGGQLGIRLGTIYRRPFFLAFLAGLLRPS